MGSLQQLSLLLLIISEMSEIMRAVFAEQIVHLPYTFTLDMEFMKERHSLFYAVVQNGYKKRREHKVWPVQDSEVWREIFNA